MDVEEKQEDITIEEFVKGNKLQKEVSEKKSNLKNFLWFRSKVGEIFKDYDDGNVEAFTEKMKAIKTHCKLPFSEDAMNDEKDLVELDKEYSVYRDRLNKTYRKTEGYTIEVYNKDKTFFKKDKPPGIRDTKYTELFHKERKLEEQIYAKRREHEDLKARHAIASESSERDLRRIEGKICDLMTDSMAEDYHSRINTLLDELRTMRAARIPFVDDKNILAEIERLKLEIKDNDEFLRAYCKTLAEKYEELRSKFSFVSIDCKKCKSKGKVPKDAWTEEKCDVCKGTGGFKIVSCMKCKVCNGSTTVKTDYGLTDCMDCLEGKVYEAPTHTRAPDGEDM